MIRTVSLRQMVGNALKGCTRNLCSSKVVPNKPKPKTRVMANTDLKHTASCTSPSIGINGFGRIGKCILRLAAANNVNVVAINQPCCNAYDIARSLKQDTVHGPFSGNLTVRKDAICVNGKRIHIYNKQKPEEIPWMEQSVNYVIDSSGKYDTLEKAGRYFKTGAQKVIVTSPSKDIPMFVRGVNYESYNRTTMPVVSSTSGTTNSAAPILNLIHKKFGVKNCLLTTTHAITARQKIHDGFTHRAVMNITPKPTSAAMALGKVIPELEGKICGNASRVPVMDVSLLKFYINVKKDTCKEEIETEIRRETQCNLKGLVTYFEDDQFVSSDFIGSTYSAIVDFNQTQVVDSKFVSIAAWYDNEIGYSNRVLDLVDYMMAEEEEEKNKSKPPKQQ